MIVSWYIYGIIMFENSFNFQVREKIFVFALNNNKKFTFNRRYKSCWFRTFIQTSAVWRSHSIYRFNGNKRHFSNHNDRATCARAHAHSTLPSKPSFNCGMCEKCTCIDHSEHAHFSLNWATLVVIHLPGGTLKLHW